MKSSRSFLYLFVALIITTAIALASFSRTLGSYFLEDDFGEVLYVSQIFSGHWDKVITNFTSNYMEIPTMKVYRPCLLLSIMADYAIWGTKAYGYFITNILFLIGTAMMLYLVLTELTRTWTGWRSALFSLFSTALFISSPLHCESISLMVGRVDIICAFFYLLALFCFIRKGDNNNWLLTMLGLTSFWIGLLTKEMAIGLPALLTAACFLFPESVSNKSRALDIYTVDQVEPNLFQRLIISLKISYPLWLSCLVYFVIRYLALGTILGGYVGSVGASQYSHILEKWTDLDTVSRIIFPFSKAVFATNDIHRFWLTTILLTILALALIKILLSGLSRRWLLLLLIWTATTLAPIYQLWGLGFNLEGARFLFFLTIPIAIFLPWLFFAPTKSNTRSDHINLIEFKLLIPIVCALCFLVVLETQITAKNNIPWVHAGKQTRALLQEGQKLAQTLPESKKAIILGIPKDIDGAHIIYNGMTFNFLMSPPFSDKYYADKFITFDPILFGNSTLLNTSRFKEELKRADLIGCYIWQPNKLSFEGLPVTVEIGQKDPFILPLPAATDILLPYIVEPAWWQIDKEGLNLKNCQKGCNLAIGPIEIDPFSYDFMEIEASINPVPARPNEIRAYWSDTADINDFNFAAASKTNSASPDMPSVYRIPLSRHWRWFTAGNLHYLLINLPPAQSLVVHNIQLISDKTITPKLKIADLPVDNRGVYQVDNKGFVLQINTSPAQPANNFKLEISQPNYFYENFDDHPERAVLSSTIINAATKTFFIGNNYFPGDAYYQIRLISLNKDMLPIGEWSDPITIKFDAKLP